MSETKVPGATEIDKYITANPRKFQEWKIMEESGYADEVYKEKLEYYNQQQEKKLSSKKGLIERGIDYILEKTGTPVENTQKVEKPEEKLGDGLARTVVKRKSTVV